ncbi:MAG: 5'-deoxynucleotidase [Clostridia bacterium]|nr:5'-deoxynucleotidase [Clostridia bacterium]
MSDKSYHFFAFISRMKYISRWGLMRNTQPENIQEHSHQVAVIAHALAVIKNTVYGGQVDPNNVAVLAIFHDCNETITGDMPTPIKYYNPDIKQAYKKVEEISKNRLISMLPQELKEAYSPILFHREEDKEAWKIVKVADRIAAYIKCIEEEKAGNNEFKKAGETIYKTLMQIQTPEVKYFMENFIPSFQLTLDELE